MVIGYILAGSALLFKFDLRPWTFPVRFILEWGNGRGASGGAASGMMWG